MAQSKIIPDLLYTKDHEWLQKMDNGHVRVGITDYAQNSLGDIVFVEMPDLERQLDAGESFGMIESVKTASDLFAPVSGVVAAVNNGINDNPEIVNKDPYGQAWMIELSSVQESDLTILLDAGAYDALVTDLENEE